jgi:hypothetical protein
MFFGMYIRLITENLLLHSFLLVKLKGGTYPWHDTQPSELRTVKGVNKING